MIKRFFLYGGTFGFLLVVSLITYDLFTETDEEKINTLVQSIAQKDNTRFEEVHKYLNPSVEPVEIIVSGKRQRFTGASPNVASATREAFEPIHQTFVDKVQESIEIENNRANVNLRLNTSKGFVNLTLRLQRHGDQWFLNMLKLS